MLVRAENYLRLASQLYTSNDDCILPHITFVFLLTNAGMHSHQKNLRFIQVELTSSIISQQNNYQFPLRIQFYYRGHNQKRSYY